MSVVRSSILDSRMDSLLVPPRFRVLPLNTSFLFAQQLNAAAGIELEALIDFVFTVIGRSRTFMLNERPISCDPERFSSLHRPPCRRNRGHGRSATGQVDPRGS
jgi:hypothetical protein